MLPVVCLCPLFSGGQESIAFKCTLAQELETQIRKIKGVKWSTAHRCWYLPLSRESYVALQKPLAGIVQLDAGPPERLPG